MALQSVNPATGEALGSFEELSLPETIERLTDAGKAFHEWRHTSFGARAEILLRAAKILETEKAKFGRLMTLEMGKTLRSAITEVEKSAWVAASMLRTPNPFLRISC